VIKLVLKSRKIYVRVRQIENILSSEDKVIKKSKGKDSDQSLSQSDNIRESERSDYQMDDLGNITSSSDENEESEDEKIKNLVEEHLN
jgi:hypothetical protein